MSFPELQQCKPASRSPLEEIREHRSKKEKGKKEKIACWVIEGKNESKREGKASGKKKRVQ